MISRSWAASGCLVAALAFGVAACGGDDDSGGSSSGGGGGDKASSVTVYSSLPLQGASRPQTTAMVNGIKLALEQVGGKAGDISVKYQSLDDSTAQAGSWTPEAVSANARKAAQDDSTAVYLGEFNSGGSAVSIRILNEVVLNQVLVRVVPQAGDADAATREALRLVQEERTCWLGGSRWHGMEAMRISVSNWSTTEDDIDRSAESIIRAARRQLHDV